MEVKYCPRCNGLKSAYKKFCSQCGVELIDLPRCKYCHGIMLPLHRFCGMCGKPREVEVPAKEEALVSSSDKETIKKEEGENVSSN